MIFDPQKRNQQFLDMDFQRMRLTDTFEKLWESSDTPPDVFSFLESCAASDKELSDEELVELILVDQALRWRSGCPWRVEDYLTKTHYSLTNNPDFLCRLAIGEYQARESIGLPPAISEFAIRFPSIFEKLRDVVISLPDARFGSKGSTNSTISALGRLKDVSSDLQPAQEESRSSVLFTDGELKSSSLGRYHLIMVIGTGSFGIVYLAYDEELDRKVAIKVPRPNRFEKPSNSSEYVAEARTVASLSHPNIVPVYDLGTTEEGLIYVVSKYIEGRTLSERIKTSPLSYGESAEMLCKIARALEHAHERRLIHRDLKPGNILIETVSSTPYLTDFGLAIREEDGRLRHEIAGTPAYMSPEQFRGEGHRLDGRSDIFSLGVILYELLTGQRPFRGDSFDVLMKQVISLDPVSPKILNPSIPIELDRICMRALSKRATDRYPNARSMAEDLENWNGNPAIDASQVTIVPKGLRSFDAEDANFFLDLLPGPRNKNGLPNSIHFWKTRIEQTDQEKSFRIGLIYGPSGCGKTSLVKAGLLPCLSKDIIAIYLESTPIGTENRILKAIRKAIPNIPVDLGLIESFKYLRRHSQKKIIIILDQFEQWLHAYKAENDTDLVLACRQCDGEKIQALLMVRDDFWMATSRFMSDVEVSIAQGVNIASVDLFTPRHALKVLTAFGRAYGNLQDVLNKDNHEFLDRAIQGLMQDNSIISVRLAVFAEMIKGKPWVPETLEIVGGTQGIGVNFLDESFSSRTALAKYKKHQVAAKLVLSTLMPELGSDIKGHRQSKTELLKASGYQEKPEEFEDLIHVLDRDLRLITPVDFDDTAEQNTDNPGQFYYQLTHDFLVPSLREWINREQQETRKGRAEIKLAELTALWSAKPEDRHLPSPLEYLSIRIHTDKKKWTPPQQKMMASARGVHGFQLALVLTGILVFVAYGLSIRNAGLEQQRRTEATQIARGLLQAETSQVPSILMALKQYRSYSQDELQEALDRLPEESNAKLHAAMALIENDPSALRFLKTRLLSIDASQFPYVRDMLEKYKDSVIDEYWGIVFQDGDSHIRFRAACALATFDSRNSRWNDNALCQFVSEFLTSVEPSELLPWRNALRPIKDNLIRSLTEIFRDSKSNPQSKVFATYTLTDYLESDPKGLFDLLIDSNDQQYDELYNRIKVFSDTAKTLGVAELVKEYQDDSPEEIKELLAMRKANAFIMLVRLNAIDGLWSLLKHTPDPRVKSYVIHWLSSRGAPAKSIIDQIRIETDASVQRALVLAIGEFTLSDTQVKSLAPYLLEIYRATPDPGLHSATEWLLMKWGLSEELNQIDDLIIQDDQVHNSVSTQPRRWFINSQRQTYVILPDTELLIGSPKTEIGRMENESIHLCRVDRMIAISSKEITRKQWDLFAISNPTMEWKLENRSSKGDIDSGNSPVIGMTWYEAAWYCNWLSHQEGIPEDHWCYIPNSNGLYSEGMKAKDRFWELKGYRLPTESEWEYACRAGTTTSRYYGQSESLLEKYAWFQSNGDNKSHPVAQRKPNDFGLFDMYGNVYEWCYDSLEDYSSSVQIKLIDHPNTEPLNDMKRRILRGGSFFFPASNIRSASRSSLQPDSRPNLTHGGFRPVRSIR